MGFKEPLGIPVIEVLPLNDDDDGKGHNGPCPEGLDKDERRKGHDVAPVVDSAGTAALAVSKPLERTEDAHAELVHKDEKEHDDVDPGIAQHADHAPQGYVAEKKEPVEGGLPGAAVGFRLQGTEFFVPCGGNTVGLPVKAPEYLSRRDLFVEPGEHALYEYEYGESPEEVIDLHDAGDGKGEKNRQYVGPEYGDKAHGNHDAGFYHEVRRAYHPSFPVLFFQGVIHQRAIPRRCVRRSSYLFASVRTGPLPSPRMSV